MRLLASQPISIAKVLDASIKLYAASFTRLTGFFVIMAIFYVSLGLFIEQLLNGRPDTPSDVQAFMLARLPALFGVVMISSLLSFVFYIAMIYRVDNVAKGREDSFSEALLAGLRKFPAMLAAVILYVIAVMGGTMFLVIPGIILSLSMAFYLYFIVVETMGGYAALKASHALVWGHWWRTMTVFMAPSIVMMVIFFALGLLATFLGATGSPLLGIASNLSSAFITPYFFTLAYVQYHDLKLRRSGADLEVRLAK
jgi:hypothetical protein